MDLDFTGARLLMSNSNPKNTDIHDDFLKDSMKTLSFIMLMQEGQSPAIHMEGG